jgi:hypothetical protein
MALGVALNATSIIKCKTQEQARRSGNKWLKKAIYIGALFSSQLKLLESKPLTFIS